ncbi:hypothetical protein BB560_001453 [Smittium megazygosporum]|uniref:Oxidation resistance protein 1 n=1 Tax=Smittium megazygosporum TaxID=133381 RepID=A0A2T9ZHH4_9FUNG|nr:hypothetical protein BB560_001453 [Smittium megazygosporum]
MYSTEQHGISYKTMLDKCKTNAPLIIAIRDSNDAVFGAFLNEPLVRKPTFYGNGTCFLWKTDFDADKKNYSVKVFNHTKDDTYFILCHPDFLAVGGGEGVFGLWISSDLTNGHSQPCSTFDNDTLSADSSSPDSLKSPADFDIRCLEVWSFE